MSFRDLGAYFCDRRRRVPAPPPFPEYARHPVCLKCRQPMVKGGKDRRGNQRWRCVPCKVWVNSYSARQNVRKRARAVRLLEQGFSTRFVAEVVGLDRRTTFTINKTARDTLCKCGKSRRHKGWCWARVQSHPARQAYLEKLRRNGTALLPAKPRTTKV